MKPERSSNSLDLQPGTTLGKFEILRKLAVGGMAEIYLARVRGTAGFEKLVVLKRILPHIAQDPAFVQMFLDEARLAATLQHSNIADVYEVGDANGEVFFTMEYVHGQDVRGIRWASRKRDEPIPLAVALAIIQGVASALDYAHDKCGPDGQPLGLVHRDVSSSNVMISYDGAIKLLDFGIARASNAQHKTQTGTLKGKIPYMSPEQCRGQHLDKRSDLFSLGTVMFEITVGRRPFRGMSDFEIMEQIVHHGAPLPSSVAQGYPAELEAILMKLLARSPDDRYQSAEEMLHDLEPFLAANRLWATPKQVGKYMRLVFSDRIAAWEQAQRSGVPLVQHVIESPETDLSEVHTPPSAFPGLRSLSQEMPAMATREHEAVVARPSQLYARAETSEVRNTPIADPSITGVTGMTGFTKMKLRSRRVGFIVGGAVIGVLGIVLVLVLSGSKVAPASELSEPTTKREGPAEPKEKTVKPVDSVADKPADQPVDKPIEKPVDQSIEKPVDQPAADSTTPGAAVPTKPVGGRPTKPVKPGIKPGPKPKPKPDKPVDPGWDPNSPFLPPEQ